MRSRRTITVVGCHAEGEVGDVIVGGVLPPPGESVFAQMKALERDDDALRRFLLREPRGSVARHVNLIVPATRPDCQAGAIIMEPTEYPPMSGSNTMCIATVLLETGMVEMCEPVTRLALDMPGGRVEVEAACRDGKCESVTLTNVPSFVDRLDAPLEVAGVGTVPVDIAYGGMWYALVDATKLGFAIRPATRRGIWPPSARRSARPPGAQFPARSIPRTPRSAASRSSSSTRLSRVSARRPATPAIVSPGRCDRSPTGTGLSARLAVLLHARGLLRAGESFAHLSIIGSRFDGRILADTRCGDRPAIVPAITGRAWITGTMTYTLDPSDPYPEGYVVADTWGTSGAVSQA